MLNPPFFTSGGGGGAGGQTAPSSFARQRSDDDGGGEWLSMPAENGGQILQWRRAINLNGIDDGRLSFSSSLTGSGGLAEVQVSVDGETWRTVAEVPPGEAWTEIDVDLNEYAGRVIYVRFVHTSSGGESAVWRVMNVRVTRRK